MQVSMVVIIKNTKDTYFLATKWYKKLHKCNARYLTLLAGPERLHFLASNVQP